MTLRWTTLRAASFVVFLTATVSAIGTWIGASRIPRAPDLPPVTVPASGGDVVDILPPGSSDPSLARARELKKALRKSPADARLAVELAEVDLGLARRTGEPRFVGQAEAALRAFGTMADPPLPVLLARATLRQNLHDFDAALMDLGAVLVKDPKNAQAWLTRAVVQTVRGEYDAAAASCDHLFGLVPARVATTCAANVDSLRGRAAPAYEALARAVESDPAASPAERAWIGTSLAEIAHRAGDDRASEAHWAAARDADPSDVYVLGSWADLLLDTGRPAEARTLLRDREAVDALLLRSALGARALGSPDASSLEAALRARFDASRLRGDTVHRREESRFELAFGDPARAKALARANWDVQKEPADMRVLLEAALRTGDPGAAEPVLRFVEATGFEDPVIRALVARLRSPASDAGGSP
ncbi:MAG: hypothetical protein U0169_17930 [Polyangiaceae bacterium]